MTVLPQPHKLILIRQSKSNWMPSTKPLDPKLMEQLHLALLQVSPQRKKSPILIPTQKLPPLSLLQLLRKNKLPSRRRRKLKLKLLSRKSKTKSRRKQKLKLKLSL